MSGSIVDWMAHSMYGRCAVPAVLRVVEGALEVVHRRADVREAAELVGPVAERRVLGQPVEGEVHLRRRALEPEALDVLDEVVGQLARVDELEERAPRIERADDGVGVVLRAVRERDAGRPAVLRDDRVDRRLEDDLGAERLRRPGRGPG